MIRAPRLLVATNDFPPRVGGTQRYVHDVVRHLPPDRVTVLAPRWPGWRAFDAAQPFQVIRYPGTFLGPVSDVSRRVRSLLRETDAEMVLYGNAFLGAMGPALRAATSVPYAMLTFGVEVWMARTPGFAAGLRHATSGATAVFSISGYARDRVARAIPEGVPVVALPPGVDTDRFHPGVPTDDIRARVGLDGGPVVVCVSRLVPRKGQDVLIQAWPRILRSAPAASLVLVGDGPYRARLEGLAGSEGLGGRVRFTGEIAEEDLPGYHRMGDVFAMPCRDRMAGLETEGFGIVYLEAAASGRAAIAGSSGGAAEAVVPGRTGFVVDGRSPADVAAAAIRLLANPERSRAMGQAARRRVEDQFAWPVLMERFASALDGTPWNGAGRRAG